MNKYNAKKTELDGIVFDSQKEASRIKQKLLLYKYQDIDFRVL